MVRGEKKKGNGTSLHDLRQTDGRNASRQETKLVHATRATRGYRNRSFFVEAPRGRGFLLYWFLFS